MNTQLISATGPLLTQMPSGREIHTLKPYHPPVLDRDILEAMRAPPDRTDDFDNDASSDEESKGGVAGAPVGAFPGTKQDYGGSSSTYY
jgi:hypothetical protein